MMINQQPNIIILAFRFVVRKPVYSNRRKHVAFATAAHVLQGVRDVILGVICA